VSDKPKTPDETADEMIARYADKFDNLLGAMELPLRPELHLRALKESLTEARKDFRQMYVAMTGDDPWKE
jgi:hypothetical protein